MDAELKARWVEALRSGKYKQGRGVLRSLNDEFCCLGVLCDVAGVEWVPSSNSGECAYAAIFEGDDSVLMLPRELGRRLASPHQVDLSNRNDKGASFADIADYIEANL